MEYERLASMIRREDIEKLAIAQMFSDMDDRIIKRYKKYKLTKFLWNENKENEKLKEYLDKRYWRLTKEIDTYKRMLNIWGYEEISVTAELSVMNHRN